MLRGLAHVGVDEQHLLIGLGHGDRQVAGDGALAVARRRRRDGDGLGVLPGQAEVERRAERADGLGDLRARRMGHQPTDVERMPRGAQVRQHAEDGQLQHVGDFVDRPQAMVEQVAQPGQAEAAEAAGENADGQEIACDRDSWASSRRRRFRGC